MAAQLRSSDEEGHPEPTLPLAAPLPPLSPSSSRPSPSTRHQPLRTEPVGQAQGSTMASRLAELQFQLEDCAAQQSRGAGGFTDDEWRSFVLEKRRRRGNSLLERSRTPGVDSENSRRLRSFNSLPRALGTTPPTPVATPPSSRRRFSVGSSSEPVSVVPSNFWAAGTGDVEKMARPVHRSFHGDGDAQPAQPLDDNAPPCPSTAPSISSLSTSKKLRRSAIPTLDTIPSSPLPILSRPASPRSYFPPLSPRAQPRRSSSSDTTPTSSPVDVLSDSTICSELGYSVSDLKTVNTTRPRGPRANSEQGRRIAMPFRRDEQEKRYHALAELVDTEASYLSSLRILVQVYFAALSSISALTSLEVSVVVRNSKEILELHERIALKIAQVEGDLRWRRLENGNVGYEHDELVKCASGRIASILLEEMPNFSKYSEFTFGHCDATRIIRSIESLPEFEAYELQCRTAPITTDDPSPLPQPVVDPRNLLSSSTFTGLEFLISHPDQSPSPTTIIGPSKLRFNDYAIRPIQRICSVCLLLGQLLKYLGEDCSEREAVRMAWEEMRKVTEMADQAKREREGQVRTSVVASRMEFQVPISYAFTEVLGPTLLAGPLHILHRSLSFDPLRIKYYGVFLYRTHLIMAKIHKRESYEPREWLPLRVLEISLLDEGEGTLPFGIRLSFREHHFELGASSVAERKVWIDHLLQAQAEARRVWKESHDDEGNPPIFDDSTISSVRSTATSSAPSTTFDLSRPKPHARSVSASSFATTILSGDSVNRDTSTPPTSPTSTSFNFTSRAPTTPTSPPLSRNRFSVTASSFLGRTPATHRFAVDQKLSDVISPECVAARATPARQAESLSAPKPSRSNSLMASVAGAKRKVKRKISFDSTSLNGFAFDTIGAGTPGTTAEPPVSPRTNRSSTTDLPRIDISAVEESKRWSSRPQSTPNSWWDTSSAKGIDPPPSQTIERNNSTSSSRTSSTVESSIHSMTSSRGTPMSSIGTPPTHPSSPKRGSVVLDSELEQLYVDVDRLRRRSASLPCGTEGVLVETSEPESDMPASAEEKESKADVVKTPDAQSERRGKGRSVLLPTSALATIFQKRAHSSSSLTTFFASKSTPASPRHSPPHSEPVSRSHSRDNLAGLDSSDKSVQRTPPTLGPPQPIRSKSIDYKSKFTFRHKFSELASS